MGYTHSPRAASLPRSTPHLQLSETTSMSQDSDIEKKNDQIATSTVESSAYVDPELDKRITWRRDRVLVPLLGTMYLIMFLDRTNIANARIEGLEAGLNMPSNGYNVALSIFYVPFVLFEVPSNLILSLPAVKPRWYLGTMVLLLGEFCWLIHGFVAYNRRRREHVSRADRLIWWSTCRKVHCRYLRSNLASRGNVYLVDVLHEEGGCRALRVVFQLRACRSDVQRSSRVRPGEGPRRTWWL